jgi:hypothetical protein
MENQNTVFNLFQEHPSSQLRCMKKECSLNSPEACTPTFYLRQTGFSFIYVESDR